MVRSPVRLSALSEVLDSRDPLDILGYIVLGRYFEILGTVPESQGLPKPDEATSFPI